MISKKKNGFRKIIIEDKIYNWRFENIIQIRPSENRNNKLEIDFGWFDNWLFINDKENESENYEPKIVTPSFIKKSIENAIKLGWNIEDKNLLFKIKYRHQIFTIEKK
jgi:hypothetical protein